MKKRIVIPSYRDRHMTMGWEKKYQNNPAYEIVVYEKDEKLQFGEEFKTSEGFKIAKDESSARSSYVFLYHLCKFYDNLFDVEIFTKTHVHVQRVRIHESIDASHKYEHLEFWNELRVFVWTNQESYEELLPRWEASCWDGEWAKISHLPLRELLSEKYQNEVDLVYEAADKLLIKPERTIESRQFYKIFKEIFPDYKLPSVLVLRNENIWSVSKKVISYHPKSLYENMLSKVLNDDLWNSISHDDWCIFWPMFWQETIERIARSV